MRIRNSIFDIIVNIICVLLLVGLVIYLIVAWGGIPDQIPGHFGADGTVTRYDSKGSLIIIPIIAWVMFLGISLVERFPQVWNTGVRVTEENKFRVYRVLKSLIVMVKLIVIALFTVICIIQTLVTSLPVWLLPVFMSLLFFVIVFSIVRLVLAR